MLNPYEFIDYDQIERLDDKVCCVCLKSPKKHRVAATCSHSYCLQCVIEIQKKVETKTILCPLCRLEVIKLFYADDNPLPNELEKKLKDYNQVKDNRSMQRTLQ